MKNNSKINTGFKAYLTLTFVLLTQLINAQTDFRAGYVIDAKNDTLIGDIDYRGDMSMGEYCVFKLKNTKNVVKYTPKDIVSYRFSNDRYFLSKSINGETVFLEFLIKGKVNIYYQRNISGDHYFIEKEDKKLVELPYKEKTEYSNSVLLSNTSTKHIGLLIYHMQDAPKLHDRISQMQKPEHNELINLAKDYHNTVCKDESCIIYKRKTTPISVHIEGIAGMINYYNLGKNGFATGILVHSWLPRTNEKLYLRTGIMYSTVTVDNNKTAFYKIPFQIEYVYPKGTIKPRFAYGVNLYKPFYVSIGAMAGFTVKLNKKFNLGFNYDADFTPNEYLFVVPSELLSQTFSVGINYKL